MPKFALTVLNCEQSVSTFTLIKLQQEAPTRLKITAIIAAFSFASAAIAGVTDVNNTAEVLRPNIHQNVGGGNNANSNGANGGGGNLHGIGNAPGQNGANPNDDGTKGFANQLVSVHKR